MIDSQMVLLGAPTGAPLLAVAPAAGPAADRLFGDLLPTLGVLVLIVLVGGGIAMGLRRRFQGRDADGSVGFTLEDLRAMRARGEISEEEFERARGRMVGGMTGTTGRTGSPERPSGVRGSVPPARSAQRDESGGNGSAPLDGKG